MTFSSAFSFPLPSINVQETTGRRWRVQSCSLRPGVGRRQLLKTASFAALAAALSATPVAVHAGRQEGVNRPELLPAEFTTVIDLENFLATGEEKRLKDKIADLEKRTGFKVRVLTQRFPQTPGLAVREYWGIDDDTVLLVADYFGGSQLLKFNVGARVDTLLPPRFWSLLSSNLGNKFYVDKNGESGAIITAVDNIRTCLLKNGCNAPPYLKDTI